MKVTTDDHPCFSGQIRLHRALFKDFSSINRPVPEVNAGAGTAGFILFAPGHPRHRSDVERIARRPGAAGRVGLVTAPRRRPPGRPKAEQFVGGGHGSRAVSNGRLVPTRPARPRSGGAAAPRVDVLLLHIKQSFQL